jgi:hypothetical protein
MQYFLPELAKPLTAPSTLVGIPTALWQVGLGKWDRKMGLLPWQAQYWECIK